MKKWIFVCLAAVVTVAWAAERVAVGAGGQSAEDGTISTLNFELNSSNPKASTLLFAADGPHADYPDIIVSSSGFDRVRISGRQVMAEGYGTLLTEPAWIELRAWDGAGTGQPDRFSIKATEADGHVFSMSFPLNIGDISIRNR